MDDIWSGAAETTLATSQYLAHIGVWLEGSMAAKRALPSDQLDGGLHNLARLPKRVGAEMRRHVMECRVSSLDHHRHVLPIGIERDRVTRAAVEGFLAIERMFPDQTPVYQLRGAAIRVSNGQPVSFTRRQRDSLREAALVEAGGANFTSAAMLLDVLASAGSTLDEHAALAADLEPLIAVSGLGQGLDVVEESVARLSIAVARATHSAGRDVTDLETLLEWTMAREMWNEAAEVIVAATGLVARRRADGVAVRALADDLSLARTRAANRGRLEADRHRTPGDSERTSADSDRDRCAQEMSPIPPGGRDRRRSTKA